MFPQAIVAIATILLVTLAAFASAQYVYYPYSPNALFQPAINVTTFSGQFQFYQEQAGYSTNGVYNGVFGVTFERTEKFLFLTSADGKKIRKLNYRTSYVGVDITDGFGWHYPMGLVVDHKNVNVYVGDRHVISRINSIDLNGDPNTEKYTVDEFSGNVVIGLRDGNGTTARYNEPRFVAIDKADRYLYISDVLNYRLRRLDLASPLYNVVTYATFVTNQQTNGIVLDSTGTFIYAVATTLGGIWKIPILAAGAFPSPSSGWSKIGRVSGTGAFVPGQMFDGDYSVAQFSKPSSITIDGQDNLYLVDNWDLKRVIYKGPTYQYSQYSVRRISTSKSFVTTMAGKLCTLLDPAATDPNPTSNCFSDGNGTTAGLSKPTAYSVGGHITAGADGDKLVFTDYGNNVVREVLCSPFSATQKMFLGECFLPTFAPTSPPTLLANTLPPTRKPSFSPTKGPTVPPTRAPTFAPTRQPVTPNPTGDCASLYVKTPAGNACPGECDGPEFKASFQGPEGVAVDPSGSYLVVADPGNNLIRRMEVSTGVVTTVLLNHHWHFPMGVAIAKGSSTVYITDKNTLSSVYANDLLPSGTVNVLAGSVTPGDVDMLCPAASAKATAKTAKRSLTGSTAAAGSVGAGSAKSASAGTAGAGSAVTGSAKTANSAGSGTAGSASASSSDGARSGAGSHGGSGSSSGSAQGAGSVSDGAGSHGGSGAGSQGAGSHGGSGSSSSSGALSSSSVVGPCNFNTPTSIDVDEVNNFVYVVDSGNNAIRRVNVDPQYTPFLPIETVVADPILDLPYGIAVIAAATTTTLYVTSFNGHNIFQIVVETTSILPIPISSTNVFAGSAANVFGHADGAVSSSLFMFPTGITKDSTGSSLYVNEWYTIPGEVDLGSTWAEANEVHETASGSGSGSAGTGSAAKAGAGSTAKAGGSKASAGSHAVSGSTGQTSGSHSTAGSAGKAAGSHGSAGSKAGSASEGSGSSTGSSSGPYGSANKISDVNWGHEPQYLHNVRKISLDSAIPEVSTIAGGNIPGIFEPKNAASSSSDHSSKSGTGSGSSAAGSTAKTAGSAATAAAGSTAKSSGSAAAGSTAKAGSIKGRALHNFDPYAGKGSTIGVDKSGSIFDGFYSFSSQECPKCSHRRRLDASSVSTDSAGGAALGIGGDSGLIPVPSHGRGHSSTGVSASHFIDGHESGQTLVDEHSSFNDGFAVYARFFHPKGIAVHSVGDNIVLWVGDQGNYRVRNISCADIGAPTFEPTFEPSARPTALPSTAAPTELPSAKPTRLPGTAKKPPNAGVGKTKAPPKGVKGASLGELGNVMSTSAGKLSGGDVAVVAVFGFLGAVLLAAAFFYRRQLTDLFLGSVAAKEVPAVASAVEVEAN